MKKIIYTIFAVCAAAIVSGCQKDTVEINSPMVGEWHLDSWLSEEQKDFDVYLSFSKDGTFEMFTDERTPNMVKFTGTYSVSGDVVSGVYSDGLEWGASYTFSFSDGDNVMTFVSNTPNAETAVYRREAIPEDVRATPSVKSSEYSGPRFL